MFDVKDPAIKLFGRTIPLQEIQTPVESGKKYDQDCQIPAPESDYKDKCIETTKSEANGFPKKEDPCNVDKSSSLNNGKEDAQIPTTEENKATIEEDQVDTNMSSQEKVLKKPDKILPCPRCNSMDTKFCYYNNYNVNQPRHFCKNCQRYWTAGGTMRNVPIGAGRRKNKHMVSQYRHMMSSEGMPTTTRVDIPDATNQQVLLSSGLSLPSNPIINGNGRVLKFGPDAPLCESMATMLSLGDQKIKVETSGEDPSCGSSGTASTCHKTEFPENVAQMEHDGIPGYCNGLTPAHPLQCYPLPPWVYLDWNNIAPMAAGQGSSDLGYVSNNSNPNPVQLGPTSMMAGPAFCSPSIPFPFVPASYWGCMPSWAARVWSAPQIGCDGSISPSSSNGSPTLGKHSRDAKSNGEEKMEKSFWVPKTLRIDNPDEAAKSSIWDTLGIKPQPNEPITKGGIVKVFQPKIEDNCHASDATQVLQANPAALSRSQTFQETT